MAIPATVIYFTIYDQLREKLTAMNKNTYSIWIPIVSGGCARVLAATTISPLEMIRTKMQSKRMKYNEVMRAVKISVKDEGIFSLWRGLGATILRDVPFSCIYWTGYESLKAYFNQPEPRFGFSFLAGATAGSIAAVATLPFDVVKTHKQIELGELELLKQKQPNHLTMSSSSTKDVIKKIYQQSGYRGLFAGLTPRIIKVAPACAIMISTYEFGKAFFRQYNYSKSQSMS